MSTKELNVFTLKSQRGEVAYVFNIQVAVLCIVEVPQESDRSDRPDLQPENNQWVSPRMAKEQQNTYVSFFAVQLNQKTRLCSEMNPHC